MDLVVRPPPGQVGGLRAATRRNAARLAGGLAAVGSALYHNPRLAGRVVGNVVNFAERAVGGFRTARSASQPPPLEMPRKRVKREHNAGGGGRGGGGTLVSTGTSSVPGRHPLKTRHRKKKGKPTLSKKVKRINTMLSNMARNNKVSTFHYRQYRSAHRDHGTNRKDIYIPFADQGTQFDAVMGGPWPGYNPNTNLTTSTNGPFAAADANLSVRHTFRVRNAGLSDLLVSVYAFKCVRTTNFLVTALDTQYWNSHTGAIPTIGTAVKPSYGWFLSDSKREWSPFWKIIKKTPPTMLGPGNEIDMFAQVKRYKYDIVKQQNFEGYWPHMTIHFVVVIEGSIAHAVTTHTDVGLTNGAVDYFIRSNYIARVGTSGPAYTWYKTDNNLVTLAGGAEQAGITASEMPATD